MPQPALLFEGVGKRFCRSLSAAALYGAADSARGLLRLNPKDRLRPQEFWALRDISFAAHPGECLGIIGPNGAGKSTLLRLAGGEHRPDAGRVAARGEVKPLIRLGTGLRPMLTGRENIYVMLAELGLGKRESDALLDGIVAFAGLEESLDAPVKRYSDGMYARLEFSIATCRPMDILLIDEVLAVGDIAFQMRCLDRLEQLKRAGTAILFVSHSEMNVRQIADRCLLLFDGEALGCGPTDALFLRYYQSLGFVSRALKPLGLAPEPPPAFDGRARIVRLATASQPEPLKLQTGQPMTLLADYAAEEPIEDAALVLEFWNPADLLMGSIDSGLNGTALSLDRAGGRLRVDVPFLGLTAGAYRVAGGFRRGGEWLGYGRELLRLAVAQGEGAGAAGLVALRAEIRWVEGKA